MFQYLVKHNSILGKILLQVVNNSLLIYFESFV